MKILIVGGVAGGATTATRLRRLDEKSEIIIFDRGDYVSFANIRNNFRISYYNSVNFFKKMEGFQTPV